VFQQSCFSIRVPVVVFQHLRFIICDSAVVFQHLRFIICDSAVVFQHHVSSSVIQQLCFSSSSVFQHSSSSRVPAVVFQHLCSHLCCSICVRIGVAASVFALVLQRLCFICVAASVFHLCCSVCVSASVFLHLFSIHNRLPSMTTLIICVISVVAIFPTSVSGDTFFILG
jgi:hypothetical protein